ncbi:hypothetical protein [Nocardia africana]|uniref:Uncharacterized protein n=1 Tax=Nocardia africana TaxID=134964 RepID=A0ABW6ND36_9NOCA
MTGGSSSKINITGSQVVAGNIGGSGNIERVLGSIRGSARADASTDVVQQLREALQQLRQQLPTSDGADAQPAEIDTVLDDLDPVAPNIQRAATKWELLMRRIPQSLRNIDTVTKIVTLITQLQELAG